MRSGCCSGRPGGKALPQPAMLIGTRRLTTWRPPSVTSIRRWVVFAGWALGAGCGGPPAPAPPRAGGPRRQTLVALRGPQLPLCQEGEDLGDVSHGTLLLLGGEPPLRHRSR